MKLSELAIGSEIYFGKINGRVLKWLVADRNHAGYPENSTTLLLKNPINFQPYYESSTDTPVNWSESIVRQRYNSDFLDYFSAIEKRAILDTTVRTADVNLSTDSWVMGTTVDKFFELARYEITPTSEDLGLTQVALLKSSDYLRAKKVQGCLTRWLLRDCWYYGSSYTSQHTYVTVNGVVSSHDTNSYDGIYGDANRPAVNLSNDTDVYILADAYTVDSSHTIKENRLFNLEAGSKIQLGEYDGNPVDWIVADDSGTVTNHVGDIVLLTEKCITTSRYGTTNRWSDSVLRELCGSLYDTMFSDEYKNLLTRVNLKTYAAGSFEDTQDYVFVPSTINTGIYENQTIQIQVYTNKLFSYFMDNSRITNDTNGDPTVWLLRDQNMSGYSNCVGTSGGVQFSNASYTYGVRLAICVNGNTEIELQDGYYTLVPPPPPVPNKVEYFGKILLDLTQDTVTPESLKVGFTAHDKSGRLIEGTMVPGGGDIKLQSVTIDPPYPEGFTVLPDAGYDALSSVTVGPYRGAPYVDLCEILDTGIVPSEITAHCVSTGEYYAISYEASHFYFYPIHGEGLQVASTSAIFGTIYLYHNPNVRSGLTVVLPLREYRFSLPARKNGTYYYPEYGYTYTQNKTLSVSKNGQYTVIPDNGGSGVTNLLYKVTVDVNVPSSGGGVGGGEYNAESVDNGDGTQTLNIVDADEIELQEKTVSPTESSHEVTPDDGYTGLSKVTVNAIDSDYVGSDIAKRTGSDLSASGATVTVPAGYYASQATKSVSTATQATPGITVNSAGLITASATQSAGYVTAGTKSATQQLSTQAAKTVTPTKSSQTAVASGVYTTGAVTVAPIPSEYIVPSGSDSTTENGTFDVSTLAQFVVDVNSLPAGIAAIDIGTFVKNDATTTTAFTVPHNLGVTPDFVFFYATANVATTYSMLGAMRGSIVNWRSGYNSFYFYHGYSTSTVTTTNSSNANYGVGSLTATSFKVASHSTSYYWRATTYKYIAIKFS